MGQRERERERPSVVRALSLASCNLLLPRHDLPLAGSLRVGLSAPSLLSDGRRGIINRRRGPSLSLSLSLAASRCTPGASAETNERANSLNYGDSAIAFRD